MLLFFFPKGIKGMASTAPTSKSKSLGALGRDEMNLAEFPITLLADRVPKDQNEAVYQDEIHDERTGLTLTRKLTITAGNHGLTTAADDDVILSLIQLTRKKNNFTDRRVEFSRHELVQMLGWTVGGASYDRLLLSLKRWTSVFLQYENAWRDNRTKTWTTAGFHIIDKYEITDSRTSDEQLELMPSYIIWGEDIFASFQAGYLKPLDYDLCMGLRNSTAKRLYRFLDKRFHHRPDWVFDLKEFAHEHIGLGRHYEGPAHLKRNLEPAIAELESIDYLRALPSDERFFKEGKDWKIRLVKKDIPPSAMPAASQTETPLLVIELTSRGITAKTAVELVRDFGEEKVQLQLDIFDGKPAKKRDKIDDHAAYLVKAIRDGHAAPKNFKSKAQREQEAETRRQQQQVKDEARRISQEKAAREKAEQQAIADYRQQLTPDQLRVLEAEALAQTSPQWRQTYEEAAWAPNVKRMTLNTIVEEHIRQNILPDRQAAPAQA